MHTPSQLKVFKIPTQCVDLPPSILRSEGPLCHLRIDPYPCFPYAFLEWQLPGARLGQTTPPLPCCIPRFWKPVKLDKRRRWSCRRPSFLAHCAAIQAVKICSYHCQPSTVYYLCHQWFYLPLPPVDSTPSSLSFLDLIIPTPTHHIVPFSTRFATAPPVTSPRRQQVSHNRYYPEIYPFLPTRQFLVYFFCHGPPDPPRFYLMIK